MNEKGTIDTELLRRYDRPGPRYTSYPTAPQFSEAFGETQLRRHIQCGNAAATPKPVSIYVHVPYCFSPCFYCGCNRVITRDAKKGDQYLENLSLEIEQIAPLFDREREVMQLHFGGGTPNFLDPRQLGRLLAALRSHFRFSTSQTLDLSIELDPRCVDDGDIAELAALGFNRASLGVQDFDPVVQRTVNRVQSVEQTLAVVDACRKHGFRSVNVDLIYGLPRQSIDGFQKTINIIIGVRPDRLAIYGYAHHPELFKAQRQIRADELPDANSRLALLRLAVESLTGAGYHYIGMDHFALPDDDLAVAQSAGDLHRNFMGYTTHAHCDLVGLGVSAISHIGDSFSQNPRDVTGWEVALHGGHLPVWRGLELDHDDVLRADVIQHFMCQGEIDVANIEQRYGINFRSYFAAAWAALQKLDDDGLVTLDDRRIAVTPRGRYLLRCIAMCFDRYLETSQADDRAIRSL